MSTTTVTTTVTAAPAAQPPVNHSDHHVTWAEGTVDNEGVGKKKSKKCCIFKKRREFGESSSDSDVHCGHSECSTPPGAHPIPY